MNPRIRMSLLLLSLTAFFFTCESNALAKEPAILRGPATRTFDLAFSSDGKRLAVAYEDGSFRVWELAAGQAIVSKDAAHENHCRSIAWGLNAELLWTTGDEGTIKSWSSRTGQPVGSAIPIEKPYRVVVCSSPERLAVASRDASIYLLPVGQEQKDRQILSGHEGPVRDLALSQDGLHLASVGHDHVLMIWDLQTGNCVQSSRGVGEGRLFAVAFSSQGDAVAFAGDGGRIQIFDVKAKALKLDWKAHEREIRSLSFSRDGKWLASVGEDVEARLWSVADGTLLESLSGHEGKAYCVACSPIEDLVAVGRSDGCVELWRYELTR